MGAKVVVWLVLAVPAVPLLFPPGQVAWSYGQTLHWSGQLSVLLLFVAMSATSLRSISPKLGALLISYRRSVGVASFGYAAIHTGLYIEHKWGADLIVTEASQLDLAFGWLAVVLLLLLALTSNRKSVRLLGRRWPMLHRLVYFAAFVTLLHWLLSSFDPTLAIVWGVLLVVVELARFLPGKR